MFAALHLAIQCLSFHASKFSQPIPETVHQFIPYRKSFLLNIVLFYTVHKNGVQSCLENPCFERSNVELVITVDDDINFMVRKWTTLFFSHTFREAHWCMNYKYLSHYGHYRLLQSSRVQLLFPFLYYSTLIDVTKLAFLKPKCSMKETSNLYLYFNFQLSQRVNPFW